MNKYFTYDPHGRLLTTNQHITGDVNGKVTLSNLTYNEIGLLLTKGLHTTALQSNPLQSINYQYNIRGWLTQMNNHDAPGNALFAMRLNYNTIEPGLVDSPDSLKYNGNITSMVWKSAGKVKQGYGFSYDGLDRLLASDYATNIGAGWIDSTSYEERGISYDRNGNITHLLRSGTGSKTINDFGL